MAIKLAPGSVVEKNVSSLVEKLPELEVTTTRLAVGVEILDQQIGSGGDGHCAKFSLKADTAPQSVWKLTAADQRLLGPTSQALRSETL